ncbi:MAG: 30S ribosomal protein S20 [Anaerolineae bacterium]
MANTKSAIKRIRSSAKKRERNRVFRSRARTFVKKTKRLIAEGKIEEAREKAQLAISALDKAAEKGVIHKKNAARCKSRLMRRLNRTGQQPTGSPNEGKA